MYLFHIFLKKAIISGSDFDFFRKCVICHSQLSRTCLIGTFAYQEIDEKVDVSRKSSGISGVWRTSTVCDSRELLKIRGTQHYVTAAQPKIYNPYLDCISDLFFFFGFQPQPLVSKMIEWPSVYD